MKRAGIFYIFLCLLHYACKSPMFGSSASPHEKYSISLKNAKLDSSAMGRAWLNAAAKSLSQPLMISLPYRETGYFDATKIIAAGYRFKLRRGEMLTATLTKKPGTGFGLFMDLWQVNETGQTDFEEAATVDATQLQVEIKNEAEYILRLQPELLAGGEYTLVIQTGPSLAFPVQESSQPRIGSFWGDPRSGGARSHEGIDIFAPKRSPVVAAIPGTVSVSTNDLGGKVIFLRNRNKNYSLYYAHLDSQIAVEGQYVKTGEVIGLMGNTGNAEHSPPHLHFGIYTMGGAIDPLPFIDRDRPQPPGITVQISKLNEEVKSKANTKMYSSIPDKSTTGVATAVNTLMQVIAASASYYKVILPDGMYGFIAGSTVTDLNNPIQAINISLDSPLWDKPDSTAASKTFLKKGEKVNVLARFNGYNYVSVNNQKGWIKVKSQ